MGEWAIPTHILDAAPADPWRLPVARLVLTIMADGVEAWLAAMTRM